ncbi:TetR family transcriptional regulator [Tamaricihabitans halophyticus]|uniref:TetR family transcriptional regulator n=1 Tax=Tamaricihabitans halophyticus TaxID=1262583 RepID=A0A4R2QQK8_9PSEU|nr:TetR family transcriptional regulator [Tamaricihabitans halophyticus]
MEYTGSGDPRRSVELLWGTFDPPKRGPRPRLTLRQIATAGIELADASGIGALSMRQVAERLDVGTMSLYTYVPSKAELVDVMVDTAYGESADPVALADGWLAGLAEVARRNWTLLLRHPWMLQVSSTRPALGPNATAKYDNELRVLDGIGLTDVEMDTVLSAVIGYVEGSARRVVDAGEAERRTGMSDEQWWRGHAPVLDEVAMVGRFPLASRVGSAVGQMYGAAGDLPRVFQVGLDCLLTGIESYVRSRTGGRSGTR